jgi:uncharacterized membrane protein YphA (DoxX/SURF4 family)
MFNKKTLNLYAVITGVFLLISGIGKLGDVAAFGSLIQQYGLGYLMVLAPLIVLIEILLGLLLILLINPKRYSLVALVLFTVFTAAFAYGHFSNGVNNCGCFGTVEQVKLPPVFSFIRNFILMGMAAIVWLKYPAEDIVNQVWKRNTIASVMCISLFVAGTTYKVPPFLTAAATHRFQDKAIKQTALAKYTQTEARKRYLFFCFSYTCPYCWNSIQNLRHFKQTNTVDSLVVLAVGNARDKQIFFDSFKPDFAVTDLTSRQMDELTKSYPTAFYVQNDSVKVVVESELPSPFIFTRMNNLSNLK